jgi:hypothetical protein
MKYPFKVYLDFGDDFPPIKRGLRNVKIESVGPKWARIKYLHRGFGFIKRKIKIEDWERIYERKNND